MPWTASLVGKELTNGIAFATIEFANGPERLQKKFRVEDIEFLKEEVSREIVRLDRAIAARDTLQVGEIPEKTQPTQDELDSISWNTKVNRLQVLISLVNLGVFTGNETQIVNLRNQIKTDFKPEYIGL